MMKKYMVTIFAVALVALAGVIIYYFENPASQPTIDQLVQQTEQEPATETQTEQTSPASDGNGENIGVSESVTVETTKSEPAETVIEMTSSGFEPSDVTVKKGSTVTFMAVGSGPYWPASDVHPSHTLYPGSSIQKCGGDVAIFDSCGGLSDGESWSFRFDEVGSWRYHDHRSPSRTGTITVQ